MRVSRGVDGNDRAATGPFTTALALCLAALLAPACRRAQPAPAQRPVSPAPAPQVAEDVPRAASVDASAARSATVIDAGAAEPILLSATPTVSAESAVSGPLDVVAAPDGAVVVYVVPSGGRRVDVVARRVGADGAWSGPPRRLRTTTGPITALDADLFQGRLWVAWIANPGGDPAMEMVNGEQIVVALAADADLSRASRPVTLMDYRAQPVGRPWETPSVEVRGLALGGAVVVSIGPSQTCVHEEGTDHAERVPCPGWSEYTIGVDGTHEGGTEGMLAATRPPWSLTRTSTGVVGLVSDDHISTKTHLRVIAGLPSPGEGTYFHATGARLAFDGARLVMIADDESTDVQERRTRIIGWGEGLSFPQDDGMWESLPPVTAHTLRCVEGRPVVRYAWRGGSIDLDPARAGACFDLAAHLPSEALPERYPALAWTGRVVVGVDPEHGTLHRWRCAGNALREVP
ncbi:MAG: hypothetical protein R3A52_16960 [Polyangiales bacterium]